MINYFLAVIVLVNALIAIRQRAEWRSPIRCSELEIAVRAILSVSEESFLNFLLAQNT